MWSASVAQRVRRRDRAVQRVIPDQGDRRTIQTRTAELRRMLTATTAYHLGARAVRLAHLDPAAIVGWAAGHRAKPTMRQLDILRLLANGVTDEDVAAAVDMSASTVRRDVQRLAAGSGVTTRMSAGALFEAFGWH